MVFDVVKKATEHITFECQRCEHPVKYLSVVAFQESNSDEPEKRYVCENCKDKLKSTIENYFWYDLVSESDFERITSYLSSIDKITCVYGDDYTTGDIIIHTKYANSELVEDACGHFGYKIDGFHLTEGENSFNYMNCFEDHGKCMSILLTPKGDVKPLQEPIEEKSYSSVDFVDESDRISD